MSNGDYSFLDHINCPVFVLELDGDGAPVYRAMNAFACSASGLPVEHFLGKTAIQVYGKRLGQSAYHQHRKAFERGQTVSYDLELPIGRDVISLRTTLSPVRDNKDAISHIYGSSINITNVDAARDARITLDTLSSEMEQFVSMAAHDLRTPMRNVALLADMLRENFVDQGDGKLELINMLEDVATKSMHLISDVLAHAGALGNATREDNSIFSMRALAQDIIDVLDPQGRHQLVCGTEEICADRMTLQIAFRNLIDNALKHADRDSVRVEITVQPSVDGMIEVTLRDNGHGFANPGKLFLQDGKFNIDSGYGLLGLKRLIAARGGDISARNDATHGGTAIRFTLPGVWVAPVDATGSQSAGAISPVNRSPQAPAGR